MKITYVKKRSRGRQPTWTTAMVDGACDGRLLMAKLELSPIGRATKTATIGAIKGTGDVAESIVEAARDVLLTALDGVTQVSVAAERSVAKVVRGAVHAAADSGHDVGVVATSAVRGTIKAAHEAGADLGKTAVAATEATIKAAEEVGGDTGKALKHAVTGAIEAADEIGTDSAKAVRDVLSATVKGAKDVIEAPFGPGRAKRGKG
jgi:hypothetical protein